ncbi:DMT family transporter [Cohnella endophytica]|uniref:DMT family transporter n=1 Tax=Cohnella endophytica TaxID=2419778 RepID=A0A494Y5Y8_9BACL|nr:DMT family transporter [Cohnella endophytica]RKP58087.1 DMT family transporter [Cohnella endophytica]
MIIGMSLAILAGSLVGLQNIFNSKMNERLGGWATTAYVLGFGFLASLILGFLFEGKQLFDLSNMKTWYGFSGMIGVAVVFCVVQGIKRIGPTYAISIVLASQLALALIWDSLGLFGLDKVPFTPRKGIGVMVIIAGLVVFKLSGKDSKTKT